MKIYTMLFTLFLAAFIVFHPHELSMTSQYDSNTHTYHMVITGDQAEIDRVCAEGDCSLTFASRLDATNYFLLLLGRANGITLIPLPPPPEGA